MGGAARPAHLSVTKGYVGPTRGGEVRAWVTLAQRVRHVGPFGLDTGVRVQWCGLTNVRPVDVLLVWICLLLRIDGWINDLVGYTSG